MPNPGIGDSSFIHRDKVLKEGLRDFDSDSYELSVIVPKKISICGGYRYDLKIFDNHEAINAFVDRWETRHHPAESDGDSDSDGF